VTGQMQIIAAVAVFIIAYDLIISGKIHYALVAISGAETANDRKGIVRRFNGGKQAPT
jgi:hypothetical protein